jgi:hypothetical protein
LNTYNVTLRYEDRKTDAEGQSRCQQHRCSDWQGYTRVCEELDRKQGFDMNKGLKIEALRVSTGKTEAPEAAAEASA